MRVLILLAAVPLTSASPAPDVQQSPERQSVFGRPATSERAAPQPFAERDCPATAHLAREVVIDATARKLGELPSGQLELAVMRQVNGCAAPAVIRSGIGARQAPSNR